MVVDELSQTCEWSRSDTVRYILYSSVVLFPAIVRQIAREPG